MWLYSHYKGAVQCSLLVLCKQLVITEVPERVGNSVSRQDRMRIPFSR